MPVFYITINVFGLKFRQQIYGNKNDYTEKELKNIMEKHRQEIKLKLYVLGYVG